MWVLAKAQHGRLHQKKGSIDEDHEPAMPKGMLTIPILSIATWTLNAGKNNISFFQAAREDRCASKIQHLHQ